MDWSWDGSIISLSSVPPVDGPLSPRSSSHSRGPGDAPQPAHPPLSAPLATSRDARRATVESPTRLPTPPERAYLSPPSSSSLFAPTSPLSSPAPVDASAVSAPPRSHERPPMQHTHSYALSLLLAEHSFSPPASPTASVASSFPGSRTRLSSCAGNPASSQDASPRSRSNRRRTRTRGRSGSVSSTVSTDGSAHDDRAGEVSSEDDHHAGGLVMPSLHLESSAQRGQPPVHGGHDEGRRVKLLVLGKTPEDRRTLATLLAHDEDLHRATSGASVAAATDMSFSFLSMRPSERSASRGARPVAAERPAEFFEPLVHADAPVALWHPTRSDTDAAELVAELTRPLERLEAKLARSYPATTGLAHVVEAAGCGDFEACTFLFSSPPLASEIALARPVSHVLPIFPVLVLPPSPTGKPQKTTALSLAVQEQLNTAGVRWVPALAASRSSPSASGPSTTSSLYMLPHDLFVQHAGGERPRAPHPVSSVASLPVSSPDSEDAPPSSLSSSQEFVTPADRVAASSYYTSAGSSIAGDRERDRNPRSSARGTARSLSASSRAGSNSSRSPSPPRTRGNARSATHRRNPSLSSFASSSGAPPSSFAASSSSSSSTSLADLHRLQAMVHDPASVAMLRARRARAFLEWRDVEVAASGAGSGESCRVPEEWGEKMLEQEEHGGSGRRMLDFSRRVAERRRVLARRGLSSATKDEAALSASHNEEDDGDVLATSDDERELADEHDADDRAGASSFATDPMTPRCTQRPLLSPLATRSGGVPARSDSYFPPLDDPTSPADALASSTHSLATTASSSSSGNTSSRSTRTSLGASSLLVLPSADPFHLPSLLHLVGLNLRLAVFAPSFTSPPGSSAGSAASAAGEKSDAESAREGHEARERPDRPQWTWWRAAAVVGLVFAAGVAVGAAASSSPSVDTRVGGVAAAAWAPRVRC